MGIVKAELKALLFNLAGKTYKLDLSRERDKSLFLSFLEGIKKLVKNIISKLIRQNETHRKHISKALNVENPYLIKSIIAFCERRELKKIEVESRDIKVINRYRLFKTVKELISECAVNFSENDLDNWSNMLKGYTNVSKEIKSEHIAQIEKFKI